MFDSTFVQLGKARLLRWNIAPFLDNGLLDLSGVGSGPGADLLWYIDALLSWSELRDKLGHMLAGSLRFEATLFLRSILHNCLGLVITLLSSFLESAASGSAKLSWLLGTSSDWCVLLYILLRNRAHFLGPLGALGVGGVTRSFILTFLFHFSCALNNVIFNIMYLLLCPAFRLVFSSADLWSLDITVLNQGSSAYLDGLIESNLFVFDEATLSEVLLTVFLLLRLVVGDISGVASFVIRVVTLHNIIILCLLNHLNLVDTSFAISTRTSGSYSSKANISVISALTLGTISKRLRWSSLGMLFMMSMMVVISTICIKWESVDKGLSVPGSIVSQLTSSESTMTSKEDKKESLPTRSHGL